MKTQFYINDKTSSKLLDTNKFDKYNLSSIWNKLNNVAIYLYTPDPFKYTNKDIVLKIMSEMDDSSLLNFCKINNQRDSEGVLYCNNETFWENRIHQRFGEIYPQENQTWKNLYLKLVYYIDKYKYKKDSDSFNKASLNGHLEVVKFLSTLHNVDASAENNASIRWASENGHLEVVKFLSTLPNVDASADYNYAIRLASLNGYLDVVKFLSTLPGVHL